MNFYFKTILFVLLFSHSALALDLKSVYLSSCHREIGLITKVSTSSIFMFNVKGKVVKIPRYEIVGVATYPLDKFPITGLSLVDKFNIPTYKINTLYKNKITPLVTGWPIGFSKNKLTFLSILGEEITFARSNIWGITLVHSNRKYLFKRKQLNSYDFLHPTSLMKCKKQTYGKKTRIVKVSPQEFGSDPIVLKREFDKFTKELKTIKMYERTQSFYAIPEIYKNKTTLGLWTYAGSRHGASNNRSNNWTPILENQFSSGPFGYQHIFSTGANTNDYFIHEEPQTQIYYKFKADYFHLSYFIDPTLILMGKRYRWFDDELGQSEYRINDMSFIEMGFDFGHFSFLSQSSELQLGYKDDDNYFFDGSLSLAKYGIEYRNHKFNINFLVGTNSENVKSDKLKNSDGSIIGFKISKVELDFFRINFGQNFNQKWKYKLSYISRTLKIDSKEIGSQIVATEMEYQYSYKYIFKALVSSEMVDNEIKQSSFLKFGLSGNLVF